MENEFYDVGIANSILELDFLSLFQRLKIFYKKHKIFGGDI
jgi:hypothetical protein